MPKPLWEMAAGADLADIFGDFRETARHPTYGPYGYVGGSRMNKRTHDALAMVCYQVGRPCIFTQGGLNNSAVKQSAQTHDGLDVGDLQIRGWPISVIREAQAVGMRCGVVIFVRGIAEDGISDNMIEHGHCVMIGAQHAHPDARAQLYGHGYSYENGGGGLAGLPRARWWGPDRIAMIEWADSKLNPANGWRP